VNFLWIAKALLVKAQGRHSWMGGQSCRRWNHPQDLHLRLNVSCSMLQQELLRRQRREAATPLDK